jgi:pimeloyl-ACP methyl ester carboxylesterase
MQQLRRHGVNLFYEEAAGGDPRILPVHGWCCDHTYFAPQFERYAARGNRAVDLRGRGQSDKPDGSYAIGVFPDILYGKTVGSGHFCQLEVPEQINAMIDRFLTIALPR